MNKNLLLIIGISILAFSCSSSDKVEISGDLQTWHKVTLEIAGPELNENSDPNPFLDYRLEAAFSKGDIAYTVPGYFAADGESGETGASGGRSWKVHFSPNSPGEWSYEIRFRKGKNIAVLDGFEGEPVFTDGATGSFNIEPSDKTGIDLRSKGRLEYTGSHYLQHSGTGEYFLKAGAGSPENFLAYRDFDGTYYGGSKENRDGEDDPNLAQHSYKPHIGDWKDGDPAWRDGKGKGIIGAVNYLASKGMNSIYFLTLNILGDGEDVWPYTRRSERYRFDCSKLDQWEVLFSHMEQKGIVMHVILQETENEQMLDGGYLDVQRKLYLKELVARFAHHNGIIWNLGEEHGPVEWMEYFQSTADTKKMADYLRKTDPYNNLIAIHTHPSLENRREYLVDYLAHPSLEGLSIQAGNPMDSHASTLYWIGRSIDSGRPWVVSVDEIGQHWKGAMPDEDDPAHDTIRKHVLWGTFMAGGTGVEWYFGYKYAHADLNCEDWRSRDILWNQSRYALDFFRNKLPFYRMKSMDELAENAYVFANPGEIYAVYYLGKGIGPVDLSSTMGTYKVEWYDPKNGGDLVNGSVKQVKGGRKVLPGDPPSLPDADWLCLITKI